MSFLSAPYPRGGHVLLARSLLSNIRSSTTPLCVMNFEWVPVVVVLLLSILTVLAMCSLSGRMGARFCLAGFTRLNDAIIADNIRRRSHIPCDL